jgi:Ca-activated chloride channel homolog
MSFALTPLLFLLLLVPVIVALYVKLSRRRARRSAELAAEGFAPNAATLQMRRKRHVPFAFFISGLSLLLFSLARPQAAVSIPRREGTVILAFDVSNSMRADDVKPSRMAVAKDIARIQ